MKLIKFTRCYLCLFALLKLSSCEENEPIPIVAFSVSEAKAEVNEEITFTNSSLNATSYSWDFGDGNTSLEYSPTHAYSITGNFTVTLTGKGQGGENSISKTITVTFPEPTASFIVQNNVLEPGEPISFKNLSINALNYSWDFGDGNTSIETEPSHSYASAGTFYVKLTAVGEGGENSISKPITISYPILNGKTTAEFNPEIVYGTMTDQDGNEYKTVKIGSQTWMAENLRTTRYNDATQIPKAADNEEWKFATTGAYCNYENSTNSEEIATYGRLYNWHAVNSGKLAPEGWHIPSDEEWNELIRNTGGPDYAGGYLKEAGVTHWKFPNTRATNATGFTALPGGERIYNGAYRDREVFGYWWSSTAKEANSYWHMFYSGSEVDSYGAFVNQVGYSVRLIKD